jgi:phosphatidylglycerophosphatase A
MLTTICEWLATLGPVGFLPAPGTCATIVALIARYFLGPCIPATYSVLVSIFTVVSWFIITVALKQKRYNNNHDPSEIVLDEVVGTLVTFIGISITPISLLFGFVLFRFFDIVKPCGITLLEKINGATGIIADDVVAGLISCCILHLLGVS